MTNLRFDSREARVETAMPGEYAFSFTPKKAGPSRLWADLLPVATDAQEYCIPDITAATKYEPYLRAGNQNGGHLGGPEIRSGL